MERQQPGERITLECGEWTIDVFECGRLGLDGGAMFGSVPRVMWEKRIAPDSAHRIPLAMRLLLLRHASEPHVILVDTGLGDKHDDRFADMFAVRNPETQPGQLPLEVALATCGVGLGDVTHVVLTHMHFDHGGGVSRWDEQRQPIPTFPQAQHYLQKANFETARRPNAREKASYLAQNLDPLEDTPLHLLEGPAEILPGLSVEPSQGHTAGMQTLRIEGGGEVVYYLADLAPTHHHLHLPFAMGYDICVRDILEEKANLFSRAVDEQARVIFEHDPDVAWGKIVANKGRFGLE